MRGWSGRDLSGWSPDKGWWDVLEADGNDVTEYMRFLQNGIAHGRFVLGVYPWLEEDARRQFSMQKANVPSNSKY